MYKLEVNRFFDATHRLLDSEDLVTKQCHSTHGHTYLAKVILDSALLKDNGMVVDFKKIKNIIDKLDHTTILKNCDEHRELVEVLIKMGDMVILFDNDTTAENIGRWISDMIEADLGFRCEVWVCEGYKGLETLSWAKYIPKVE